MICQSPDLISALKEHDGWVVKENENTLVITNEDNIDAFLAISGEQILVEVLLFSKDLVKNPQALNEYVLKTHKMFSLTTIGINEIDGDEYYVAFGSLSSQSKLESVIIEVATLFRNVEAFIELYQEYLVDSGQTVESE
ncbi:DUF2170 family protein [Vibrio algarum]|uniref:DUF2170 family protein n=1 Tax=Vibrio algarum TaxID=3020714 RepID=A0ABT4YTU8_9VIBR|nr:DUF2170 family protein [Vibrio sp. KJ40-1]MDB1124770.1 DUF2170 family protein [Vibrio sp. KJ40-1]